MKLMLPRTVADIARLRESVALECKLAAGRDGKGALPEDFWPTYSAFANTNGGLILLGLREMQGHFILEGLEYPAKLRTELFNNLNNRQKVSANLLTDEQVQTLTIDGKNIIAVQVPRAKRETRPVYLTSNPFAGHTYRRLNGGDRPLPDEDVKRIPVEQALQGGVSDCRNRTMQQMFLMIGLGERAGSGMSRILHGWQDLGHDLQLLERYEPQEHTVLEMRWHTEPAPTSSVESSVETSAQILSLLSNETKLTAPIIAQRLGLTTRAVEKQLAKLKSQNRLHRVGPNKGGHWEVQP